MCTASVRTAKTQKGTMLILAEQDSHRPCEACRMHCTASVFSANHARRTAAPQGATHQLTVRSQGSLLVAGISDGFATGAYGQQAAAPLIHHSSFIIGKARP